MALALVALFINSIDPRAWRCVVSFAVLGLVGYVLGWLTPPTNLLTATIGASAIIVGGGLATLVFVRAQKFTADLRGLRAEASDLSGSWLFRANLRGANLRGADLRRVMLVSADLTDADLTGCDLRGANLTNADLTGALMKGAVTSDGPLES